MVYDHCSIARCDRSTSYILQSECTRRRWALHFALEGKGQDTLIFVMCFLAIIPLVSPAPFLVESGLRMVAICWVFVVLFLYFHWYSSSTYSRQTRNARSDTASTEQSGVILFSHPLSLVTQLSSRRGWLRLVEARCIDSWLIRLNLPFAFMLPFMDPLVTPIGLSSSIFIGGSSSPRFSLDYWIGASHRLNLEMRFDSI
jgi:hypothetical protein